MPFKSEQVPPFMHLHLISQFIPTKPCSQAMSHDSPIHPGRHSHVPVTTSQDAPFIHPQTPVHPAPNRPRSQACSHCAPCNPGGQVQAPFTLLQLVFSGQLQIFAHLRPHVPDPHGSGHSLPICLHPGQQSRTTSLCPVELSCVYWQTLIPVGEKTALDDTLHQRHAARTRRVFTQYNSSMVTFANRIHTLETCADDKQHGRVTKTAGFRHIYACSRPSLSKVR